jgi:radical SAM superfamily enzyme YgiQ (UPF0313 family)
MFIEYDQPVYRPPSEAYSLILQATLGCTHNRCAFCVAYQSKQFRVRPEKDLFAEIDWAAGEMPDTRRVFLADGDAFALSPAKMIRILNRLYEKFPYLERVTAYASPQNFKSRNVEDIRPVRQAGLTMLYFGLESGDDEVLKRIDKGATCDEMVQACHKAQQAGFDLSVTVILGLAGPQGSKRHAELTAKALDRIRPKFAAALTLMLAPRSPSYPEVYNDPDWRVLDPVETLKEIRVLLDNLHADGITFRSNHASNYLALKGDLQKDKQHLLEIIDAALNDPDSPLLRPEFLRAL